MFTAAITRPPFTYITCSFLLCKLLHENFIWASSYALYNIRMHSFWLISFYLWLVLVFLFSRVYYGFTPLRHHTSRHYTSWHSIIVRSIRKNKFGLKKKLQTTQESIKALIACDQTMNEGDANIKHSWKLLDNHGWIINQLILSERDFPKSWWWTSSLINRSRVHCSPSTCSKHWWQPYGNNNVLKIIKC
jgi:hypothetical protein